MKRAGGSAGAPRGSSVAPILPRSPGSTLRTLSSGNARSSRSQPGRGSGPRCRRVAGVRGRTLGALRLRRLRGDRAQRDVARAVAALARIARTRPRQRARGPSALESLVCGHARRLRSGSAGASRGESGDSRQLRLPSRVALRRILRLPGVAQPLRARAGPLGFAIALLWTLHPLTSEVVLYTVQRTEALARCFALRSSLAPCAARESAARALAGWRGRRLRRRQGLQGEGHGGAAAALGFDRAFGAAACAPRSRSVGASTSRSQPPG